MAVIESVGMLSCQVRTHGLADATAPVENPCGSCKLTAAARCQTDGQTLYPMVPSGYGTVADLCPTSCGVCSADGNHPQRHNGQGSCLLCRPPPKAAPPLPSL